MQTCLVSAEEVLAGYDVVSRLYPHIPPMSLWRAWEYACYRRYALPEPVLDVGCGDGHFFRLVWPGCRDVVGVEMDPGIADAARGSGVYRDVRVSPAHELRFPPNSFASAFANCSLEHMDHLPDVLARIRASLRPGGSFLFSVVTEKFIQWTTLPVVARYMGETKRSATLQAEYETYHHLVNPLPVHVWVAHLSQAGFELQDHLPIIPEMSSRLFLSLDHLWHLRDEQGELGARVHGYLATIPNFPESFRQVLAGVLQMERDYTTGSGAVFCARRRE